MGGCLHRHGRHLHEYVFGVQDVAFWYVRQLCLIPPATTHHNTVAMPYGDLVGGTGYLWVSRNYGQTWTRTSPVTKRPRYITAATPLDGSFWVTATNDEGLGGPGYIYRPP